ncbi:MAG: hypothetical protein LKJ75_04975 [Clostridia bacterium]|jgi:uncharacterized protein with FMN-binding domain|nr:hypothetical protein [Clostridia bacterium]MCI2014537.1 hypothetical protein [Clostridia bacterium]
MGANRFLVLKIREIIKAAVLFVIVLAVILGLLHIIFGGKDKGKDQAYIPGTYASDIVLDNGTIAVEVKFSKNKIKSVKLKNTSENVPVFYPLFESSAKTLAKQVVENQGVGFSYNSDSPVTNQLILDAVQNSIDKAKVKQ